MPGTKVPFCAQEPPYSPPMIPSAVAVAVMSTPSGRRAAEWAIDRAIELRHRLILLAVVDDTSSDAGKVFLAEQGAATAQLLLDGLADHARERGVETDARVVRGEPVSTLTAASRLVRLLVIGSGGPAFIAQREPAAATVQVAGHAQCPVAVIPGRDLGESAGVVVGVDGSEVSERAIRFAAEEADRRRDVLIAVTAWSPRPMPMQIGGLPREYLSTKQRLAEEELAVSIAGLRTDFPDVDVRTVVEPGAAVDLLVREAGGARMAVVGSHGRGSFGRFFLGSTSQALLERLPTAVVIVR